jgi:hypothetical protein
MMKHARLLLILVLLVSLPGCLTKPTHKDPSRSPKSEISRERAIEIGRTHVKFQPKSITAEKTTDSGRPVWRVTFRGEPVSQVHPMGEVFIVIVDRKTGEIVSVAQS